MKTIKSDVRSDCKLHFHGLKEIIVRVDRVVNSDKR